MDARSKRQDPAEPRRVECRSFDTIPAEPYIEPPRHPDGTRVTPPEWHQRLGVGPGSFTQVITDMLYAEVFES